MIAMYYVIGGKTFLVINEVREPCFCYTNHIKVCREDKSGIGVIY